MREPVWAAALVLGVALVAVGSCLPVVEGEIAEPRTSGGPMMYVWMDFTTLSVLRCAAGGPSGTVQILDTYIETGGTAAAWRARLLLGSLLAAVGLVAAGLRRSGLAASGVLVLSIGWLYLAVGAPHVGPLPRPAGPRRGGPPTRR